jgi:hypothetical protein
VVGEKLQVSWSGTWYDATIIEIGQGHYKVHYEGWSSDWDEWVAPSRLRRQDGSAVPPQPATPIPSTTRPEPAAPTSAPTPAPAPPKIWSTSPMGRYVCRTWDYGQVNRVGEFVLQSSGRYQDVQHKGSGRYRFDKATNRITFSSGPQKTDAKITFDAAGHTGKGHIVFDYGFGARLDCYREALR